ncbi:MAG: hypothetical protein FWF08_09765, partial [Oscillospiraceae bacterium]|nr:hypothetical protein [Oscillospiraceae bacterium]
MNNKQSWVETWGMSHAPLSLMSFSSRERTFRLIISSAISGERVRIRLCNQYSDNAVAVGRATIAVCDKSGKINDISTVRQILFKGKEEIALNKGEKIISDETEFNVPADSYICADIYIK